MTASAGDGATGSATDAAEDATASADATDDATASADATDDATASADAADGPVASAEDVPDERSYSGIFGAFPYAFRHSDSRLFRAYAVVGGLAAALVAVLFVLAVVVAIANTTGGAGGTFTFSRAFFVFLMMLVIAPLVAPILAVARRHRRRATPGASAPSAGYDRALAATGFLFLLALYAGLGISVPPALQEESPGAIGAFLYSLPRAAGAVPPLAGAALIYLVHRYYR
jgi:hypothetical protein